MEPLFLKPVFMERIWGGTALKDKFNYDIPSSNTGECWAVSSHENGDCTVLNGKYKGIKLSQLWSENREIFGNIKGDKFPLLAKILDANDNLSVQVHPDNEYANLHENGELGKTECWYIIDCEEDARLVLGHNANSREELSSLIANNQWDDLLRIIKIKKGDFFYVPSGTIHALCKGTLAYEVQQNSDTTYRVYDYDRVGTDGNKRELHVDKSIDVTTVPSVKDSYDYNVISNHTFTSTNFISNEFFSVYRLDIFGSCKFIQDKPFALYSVIDGSGSLTCDAGVYPLSKGDHFILPYKFGEFSFDGNVEIICSHI